MSTFYQNIRDKKAVELSQFSVTLLTSLLLAKTSYVSLYLFPEPRVSIYTLCFKLAKTYLKNEHNLMLDTYERIS